MMKMEITVCTVGEIGTNCYLAVNRETKEALIVDPGDNAMLIMTRCGELGIKPSAILLTHGHFDHVLAVPELRQTLKLPVYMMEEEQNVLGDASMNLSAIMASSPIRLKADHLLKDGDQIELAGFCFRVIHTPGHTVGSCCYYEEEEQVLFSGDTLFEGSYGRTDFPTGNISELIRSIQDKLLILPDEVRVYPGHMGDTTIAVEKRYNPAAARF